MHVDLRPDAPQTLYTNLDQISGNVILSLPSATDIVSIVVKLEGESRTRLIGTPAEQVGDRPKPQEELHKVLYKIQTVFPPQHLDTVSTSQRHYTLSQGQYEYPFNFKIPFNNTCSEKTSQRMTDFGRGYSKPYLNHVRTTLPPTLTAFPGLAEIRYFMKVTVNRREFYKENPRVIQHFNFLPIEPPRKPSTAETYLRRQHHFQPLSGPGMGKAKKLFRKTSIPDEDPPPHIMLDARLPTPAVLTCNDDVPIRLLVKRMNESSEALVLQSLQIELVGTTKVTANRVGRAEISNWVIASYSNMNQLLQTPPVTKEGEPVAVEIDPHFWRGRHLPNAVAPTFQACNISRSYKLQIVAGIGWGEDSLNNQVQLPLTHEVDVYSGISPPPALLEAMARDRKKTPARKPVQGNTPITPISPSVPEGAPGPSSSAQGQPTFAPLPLGEEEPPPSYEDAIAQDMPPLDGPRRVYDPPPMPAGAGFDDSKRGRRDS